MQNELKPCPFCGGKATVSKVPEGLNGSGLYVVGCNEDELCMGNINHFTMLFLTRRLAINSWNRRVENAE